MSTKSQLELQPRSAEVVRNYIDKEIERASDASGRPLRLPPIHKLAKHLDVSASTVNLIYKEFAAQGKIQSRPGRGSFLVSGQESNNYGILRIATNSLPIDTDPPERMNWRGSIEHGITSASMEFDRAITLLHIKDKSTKHFTEPRSSKDFNNLLTKNTDNFDCAFLFSYSGRNEGKAILRKAGKPYVEISQPEPQTTANFVSNDFFASGFHIGRAWRECGRKRLLSIGVEYPNRIFPPSLALHMGFMDGSSALTNEVSLDFLSTDLDQDEFNKSWKKYLKKTKKLPDAILSISDLQAGWALEALEAENIDVPGEVSVAGCSGILSSQLTWPGLTQIVHPLKNIGREAMKLMMQRMENPSVDLPGVFLPPQLMGKKTIRPEEVRAFEKSMESSF